MRFSYVLILLPYLMLLGQNPYTINYSIDEGLPTSNVYSVFEDKEGFLWFGTDVGVLRYNGYTFKHFSTDDGLSDNEVFNIYQDAEDRIWFLTLNGSLSFYEHGKFNNTKNNSLLKEASHDKLVVEAFEIEHHLYVLYRDGQIRRINNKSEQIDAYQTPATLFGHWVEGKHPIYLTLESVLDHEMNLLHTFSDKIHPYFAYRAINYKGEKIFANKWGLLKVTESGVVELDNPKISDDIIDLEEIDSNLWIGTRNGLVVKSGAHTKKYFMGDVVSNSLKDSQGNYWITTLNNGIKFIPNFYLKQYLPNNESLKVTSLQFDAINNLWIGTEKGLFLLSKEIEGLDYAYQEIINEEYIKNISTFPSHLVVNGNDRSYIIDNFGVKSYGFGANDFHYDGKHFYIGSSMVYKCLPTDIDKIPSLTNNEEKKHRFKDFNIFRKRTNVLKPYENKGVFFGTTTGLFVYSSDSIYSFKQINEPLNSSIQDIEYNTKLQRYAIATNSKGVSIIKNELIEHQISKKQGLSSNTCNVVKPLRNGFLVGTNRGLDHVALANNTFEVTSLTNKLRLDEEKINDIAVNDSLVFLATDKGLLSFNWSKINENRTKPKLVIQKVLINNGQDYDLSQLKSSENNLSIQYTGISYADFSNISYEYRINKGSWTATSNRNLEIKNLNNGKQNIELRAKGKNGIWSDIKQIKLNIKPPFYKTLPFILLITIAFLSFLYFIIVKRINTLRKGFNKERKRLEDKQEQIQIEKQMLDLEQKALRMQMNPHFIFNALNTIKGYYSGGNLKEANNYITQLSKLLRLILENDERLITIEKEIEIITLYMKLIQLRYIGVFDYEIHVDPKIDPSETAIPSLILQPLVENAVIHGLAPKEEKGKLIISFHKNKNQLTCKVTDNGVGYTKSLKKNNRHNENTSKALKITKERIDIENNNSDINFEIKDGKNNTGTEVTIKLPLQKIW